ncbi:hypothetical protein [Rhodopirellula sp. P2]|uniref:hypothetical protein n=1 Tax=Rhodopirellula sp. P2 TaxID=2127060 RepID=UPI0023682A9E|nr:hypothetical protein [Rhodopirellula sp. P2]WDQ17036.1 hypothetical protein PSR62_00435 [Rhodopirellula sp. P2]
MATKQANKTTRPTQEFRLGRIRAAIWENETDNGVRHNVTISRLYRTDDGEWKDSTSFGREDLLLVGKVMDRCHTWIYTEARNANGESNGNGKGRSNHDEGRDDGNVPF